MNSSKEVLRTTPTIDPTIAAEEGYYSDRLDKAILAIKAHNRTLLKAGYTDEQIVGIINAAIKETGDDLTIDNFLDAPVAALQAEVDRLKAGITRDAGNNKIT
jgi:hypothetical protein